MPKYRIEVVRTNTSRAFIEVAADDEDAACDKVDEKFEADPNSFGWEPDGDEIDFVGAAEEID